MERRGATGVPMGETRDVVDGILAEVRLRASPDTGAGVVDF
jgi:hypothetical protein